MTLNTSSARDSMPWTAQNGTRTLIANLQLAQVQTIRTMHLTLGAFSLALALLIVHRITSDAKRAASVQVTLRKKRFSSLQNVHPAETFPLVLACGVAIQQIIFVSVQSTSLRSVLSNNCRGLAMITFPSLFIIGYITLVFGIEMALRAFKYERFAPRGKWNTPICIGVTSFMLLLTWIPTIAWPMYNRCFGSLIWFPVRYELIAIVILGIMVSVFLILAAAISIQLMRTSKVDQNERIAASRMCYYLLIAAVIYILVLPVEIQAHRRDFMNTLATSRIAEISLFTSGMVISFFHLFLRVNATRLVIKPIAEMTTSSQQKRPRIRFFGPSDLDMTISGPLALQGGRRPDSRQGLIDVGPEKNRYDFDPEYFAASEKPLSPGSTKSNGPIDPTKWPLPPDPVQTGYVPDIKQSATGGHKRNKSNYSLFPTRAEDIPRLPPTVYSPPKPADDRKMSKLAMRRQTRQSSLGDAKSITDIGEAFSFLTKPPSLFGGRHQRSDSTDSSATVQIGLRFSVAPATLAAAKCTKVERSPLRRENTESSNTSLGLPIQSPSSPSPSSSSEYQLKPYRFPSAPRRSVSPTEPAFVMMDKGLPPTPRTALPGPPPPASSQPAAPTALGISGLRMNPISPASTSAPDSPSTPGSPPRSVRSALSPTARIGLGAGTMARSPPPNGWI
ncbi:hypothetical protein BDV95DRAFT_480361 [Massariosphaeria phaeospora]|uniref:Uncharacterized protein n=1 Tax=Massariosphaeria phaeospora TaxID=100035 RepID=A0A7C8MHL6_9PLEO|nr:hypothetical protein BDV95DRAFT_480361 [Massariosphaeria phaeospora]